MCPSLPWSAPRRRHGCCRVLSVYLLLVGAVAVEQRFQLRLVQGGFRRLHYLAGDVRVTLGDLNVQGVNGHLCQGLFFRI